MVGVFSCNSTNNTITRNLIKDNSYYGLYIEPFSNGNSIYHNNFINNSQHAHDECNNVWNDIYPSGGNYWDDYLGVDNNGDGIGDTPYLIPGGSNIDEYPLIDLWIGENIPPEVPVKPSGKGFGVVNKTYTYTSSASDPNEDMVYYMWDWGDGNNSGWIGPYNSGENANASHAWSICSGYTVRVKAKDGYGSESVWSEPYNVKIAMIQKEMKIDQPPESIKNIHPEDFETNVDIDVDLAWISEDSDEDTLNEIPLDFAINSLENAIYVNNRKTFSFFVPVIFGQKDIEITISNNYTDIQKVEFFVDGILKKTDFTPPFSWTWDERSFLRFRHQLKVIMYDVENNSVIKDIVVYKIC